MLDFIFEIVRELTGIFSAGTNGLEVCLSPSPPQAQTIN
jgi:hypothetical protein